MFLDLLMFFFVVWKQFDFLNILEHFEKQLEKVEKNANMLRFVWKTLGKQTNLFDRL